MDTISFVASKEHLETPSGGRNDILSDIHILEQCGFNVDLFSIDKNGSIYSIQRNQIEDYRSFSNNYLYFSGFQSAENLYKKYGLNKFKQIKVINIKDVHFYRELRMEMLLSYKTNHQEIMNRELKVYKTCNLILSYSKDEIKLLKNLDPLLNIQQHFYYSPTFKAKNYYSNMKRLVFSGNFKHRPNADGINHLISKYGNVIENSGYVYEIYGAYSYEYVKNPHSLKSIKLMGFVKDSLDIYKAGGVFLSPLRFGAGIKIKLIEAALCNLPIIATKESIEGLPLEKDISTLIYTDLRSLESCLKSDDEILFKIAQNARRNVEKMSNPDMIVQNLRNRFKKLRKNIEKIA